MRLAFEKGIFYIPVKWFVCWSSAESPSSNDEALNEVFLEDSSMGHCEQCGRLTEAHHHRGPKRFCSTSCARRYSVSCSRKMVAFHARASRGGRHSSANQLASNRKSSYNMPMVSWLIFVDHDITHHPTNPKSATTPPNHSWNCSPHKLLIPPHSSNYELPIPSTLRITHHPFTLACHRQITCHPSLSNHKITHHPPHPTNKVTQHAHPRKHKITHHACPRKQTTQNHSPPTLAWNHLALTSDSTPLSKKKNFLLPTHSTLLSKLLITYSTLLSNSLPTHSTLLSKSLITDLHPTLKNHWPPFHPIVKIAHHPPYYTLKIIYHPHPATLIKPPHFFCQKILSVLILKSMCHHCKWAFKIHLCLALRRFNRFPLGPGESLLHNQ